MPLSKYGNKNTLFVKYFDFRTYKFSFFTRSVQHLMPGAFCVHKAKEKSRFCEGIRLKTALIF